MPPFDPRQIVFEASFADHAFTIAIALLLFFLAYKIQQGKVFFYTLEIE